MILNIHAYIRKTFHVLTYTYATHARVRRFSACSYCSQQSTVKYSTEECRVGEPANRRCDRGAAERAIHTFEVPDVFINGVIHDEPHRGQCARQRSALRRLQSGPRYVPCGCLTMRIDSGTTSVAAYLSDLPCFRVLTQPSFVARASTQCSSMFVSTVIRVDLRDATSHSAFSISCCHNPERQRTNFADRSTANLFAEKCR